MTKRALQTALLMSVLASGLGVCAAPEGAQGPSEVLSRSEKGRIDALFKSSDSSTTPGCAMGVMRGGHLVYSRGYGMADLERKVPITASTVFDVGSTSKQFTAGAIVLLALEGKISLSDDIRKYVPELPDFGATISIDQLLWHTSGLRDYVDLLLLGGTELEEVATDQQTLQLLARQRKLNFVSGTRHEYSNTGYFLLSIVVQRVTGQSLAQFANARIFQPLGMANTVIRNDHAMLIPGRALGYTPAGQGTFELAMSNWEQTGDGSVHISLTDFLLWDENFYTARLGGRGFVEQMESPGYLANAERLHYARGLFVDSYRGLRDVHHGGSWVGYKADVQRFPEQHTTVAVFCNNDAVEPAGLSRAIADIVLAGAFRESREGTGSPGTSNESGSPGVQERSRLLGIYFSEERDAVFQIIESDGVLALKTSDTTIRLDPTGPRSFALGSIPGSVEFDLPASGSAATALHIHPEGRPATVASRLTPIMPAGSELQAFAGAYYSEELEATWSVVVDQGRLGIKRQNRRSNGVIESLEPAMAGVFYGDLGLVRFFKDSSGRVGGFELSASRMRAIRFESAH